VKPGTKPTPTALRVVRGNPGKRPMPADPQVAAKLPSAPRHLTKEARAEWRRAGRALESAGLIATIDRALFEAYCTAYGRMVEAEKKIAEFGLTDTTPNGMIVKSAWLQIADRAIAQLAKLAPEFGMSPSARTRVAPAQSEASADDFEELMSRGKRHA
jgi:P27 family predicted phage terminase small subunit